MQQGSAHVKNGVIRARIIPKCKIYIYGERWTSDRALDYIQKGMIDFFLAFARFPHTAPVVQLYVFLSSNLNFVFTIQNEMPSLIGLTFKSIGFRLVNEKLLKKIRI